MTGLHVHIDITDWQLETLRAEIAPGDRSDIADLLAAGVSTGQVARAAVVLREMGLADADILPANKPLFYAGARAAVSEIARERRSPVTTPGGTYSAPALVGNPATMPGSAANGHAATLDGVDALASAEPDEDSYVTVDDPRALQRAVAYLTNNVIGHIWPRLLIIHEHGGDLRAVADQIKCAIDERVSLLLDTARQPNDQ